MPAEISGPLLAEAAARLAAAGIENPRREARLLLAAAGLSPDASPPADPLEPLLRRREAREPLAFITGRRGFWTLDLAVSPATLIPRPDSETLIEATIAHRPDRASIRTVLDLGTGTGALLLATLLEYPGAVGLGIDRVPAAAVLARANAATAGLARRAVFAAADWAGAIDARFDLILCNPPYIQRASLAGLDPEVLHEPATALDGGPDGLAAYCAILPTLPRLLTAGTGLAVLELGAGAEEAAVDLATRAGLSHLDTRADLAGIPRAAVFAAGASPIAQTGTARLGSASHRTWPAAEPARHWPNAQAGRAAMPFDGDRSTAEAPMGRPSRCGPRM